MFYDLALHYDADLRRCDLLLGDDLDLAIDTTSVTPMIMSLGLDRRAAPDDELPSGRTDWLTPASLVERRGAIGDALGRDGDWTGSKDWLVERAKQTETTRQLVEFYTIEALAWAERITGVKPEIEVWWVSDGILGRRVMVDGISVSISRRIS